MSETWEARLKEWRRAESQRQASAGRESALLREQAKALAKEVDRIAGAQGRRAQQSADALEKILSMQDDPVVMTRNYGGNRRVYHVPNCGWIGFRGGFDKILLTEAHDRGLRPCTSCGGVPRQPA